MALTDEQLQNWFTYHATNAAQQLAYEHIRSKALELAVVIRDNTPPSADQTAALRKLRECVMTANASIACEGK